MSEPVVAFPEPIQVKHATSLKPSALEEAVEISSVVLFYAPWCGACEEFMPTYEKFAKLAKSEMKNILVLKINYDKYENQIRERKIGDKLSEGGVAAFVKNYPTVMFFHNKKVPKRYQGNQTVESLRNGMTKFMESPSQEEMFENTNSDQIFQDKELLSVDEPSTVGAFDVTPQDLTTLIEHNKNSLLMVYAPWCGYCKRSMGAFDETAKKLSANNVTVAKLDYEKFGKEVATNKIGQSILQEKGFEDGISSVVKGFPTILMFSNKEVAKYTGPRTPEDLSNTMLQFVKDFSA